MTRHVEKFSYKILKNVINISSAFISPFLPEIEDTSYRTAGLAITKVTVEISLSPANPAPTDGQSASHQERRECERGLRWMEGKDEESVEDKGAVFKSSCS